MSSTTPAAYQSIAGDDSKQPSVRRRSMSSTGSRRSRSSSSSRSSRRKIVVSEKRRLLILALRYVVSQKEYSFIRHQVLLKAPAPVAANTPTRTEFDVVVKSATWDDFLPASSRAGLRMFILYGILLNGFEYASGWIRSCKQGTAYVLPKRHPSQGALLANCCMATVLLRHGPCFTISQMFFSHCRYQP